MTILKRYGVPGTPDEPDRSTVARALLPLPTEDASGASIPGGRSNPRPAERRSRYQRSRAWRMMRIGRRSTWARGDHAGVGGRWPRRRGTVRRWRVFGARDRRLSICSSRRWELSRILATDLDLLGTVQLRPRELRYFAGEGAGAGLVLAGVLVALFGAIGHFGRAG